MTTSQKCKMSEKNAKQSINFLSDNFNKIQLEYNSKKISFGSVKIFRKKYETNALQQAIYILFWFVRCTY